MTSFISAVIFDLNGVFIKSPPLSKRFEEKYGVDKDIFFSALSKVMDVVRKPNAPDTYSLFLPYFKEWNLEIGRDTFYHFWFSAEMPDDNMISIARDLKRNGIKVFALSNNFRERAEYYHTHFSFMANLFEEVRYSWATGLVKPDENCWKSILQKYNLLPEKVLYFDDSEKNVAVASSLGVKAHKFEGASQVSRICKLEEMNLNSNN